MKWLSPYNIFLENQTNFLPQKTLELKAKQNYNPKNLVSELCIGMLLINNNFLDDILDRGLKARYSENSQVFLSDLKLMLINKNRLKLGKFEGDLCVEDEETSRITNLFDSLDFDIERDWNVLIDARIIARNICDKILQDEKLTKEQIKCVYWVGLEENKIYPEDIVIELETFDQLGIVFNKSLTSQKSSSFNLLGDNILGVDLDNLYKGEYQTKWDKLIQMWVKIIFENVNKNYQVHIEKFIEPDRIDSLTYFEFFDLKNKDIRFKNIGEHIKEFDKNILKLHELLNEIWKHRETCFMDSERIYKEWNEKKVFILNSKILEHIFTESLIKNYPNQIKRKSNGFKTTEGDIKMRMMKILVEKLGAFERPLYLFSNKGNTMDYLPSRDLFRKIYDNFDVEFDYHVKMVVEEGEEDSNDFKLKIKVSLDDQKLFDLLITVGFSGGEVSSKLGAKFKFIPVSDFNLVLIDKMNKFRNED
jgi:hypothetical protein